MYSLYVWYVCVVCNIDFLSHAYSERKDSSFLCARRQYYRYRVQCIRKSEFTSVGVDLISSFFYNSSRFSSKHLERLQPSCLCFCRNCKCSTWASHFIGTSCNTIKSQIVPSIFSSAQKRNMYLGKYISPIEHLGKNSSKTSRARDSFISPYIVRISKKNNQDFMFPRFHYFILSYLFSHFFGIILYNEKIVYDILWYFIISYFIVFLAPSIRLPLNRLPVLLKDHVTGEFCSLLRWSKNFSDLLLTNITKKETCSQREKKKTTLATDMSYWHFYNKWKIIAPIHRLCLCPIN